MQNLPRGAPPPFRFQFSDYTFLTVSQDKITIIAIFGVVMMGVHCSTIKCCETNTYFSRHIYGFSQ